MEKIFPGQKHLYGENTVQRYLTGDKSSSKKDMKSF